MFAKITGLSHDFGVAETVSDPLLRIAIPTPLYRSFDYLPPGGTDCAQLQPGMRVRVPFGRRHVIGVLLAVTTDSDVAHAKLKPASAVIDRIPVIGDDVLAMVLWASAYYHCPIGEAMAAAMPVMLRRGEAPDAAAVTIWQLSAAGRAIDPDSLTRAPRQAAVMTYLMSHPNGVPREAIDAPAAVLHALADKGWIIATTRTSTVAPTAPATESPHQLNPDQQQALDAIQANPAGFQPWLLEGVTGSGKTEVYLRVIEAILARQQQVLVLVPEIGLTPQLVARFRRRFPVPLALLHSGLSERERLTAWQQARSGAAPVVIGTRSAIFTPLARPGLLVVDEEHDASLKQQDGFRYSARDLAVWRARHLDIPIVLGSRPGD